MDHRLRPLHAGRRRFLARAPGAEPRGSSRAYRRRPLGLAAMSSSGSPAWPAPAKLNLFLHIVGRRPDGYHELQSCFQFVDLCDEITFDVRADGRIRRTAEIADVPEEADLCVRAARALQSAAGSALGSDISVLTRIPLGGGRGGGSSEPATCLEELGVAHGGSGGARLEVGGGCARVRPRPGGWGRRNRGAPDPSLPAAGPS